MMNKRAILIVDDEKNILSSFKRLFFADNSLTIYTAESGPQGLKLLAEHKIDLVISDQQMPAMKGLDFLLEVKKSYPKILRILMTGYTDLETAVEAINKGRIYRYLNKPWNNEDLKVIIHNALDYLELKGRYINAERRLKMVYKRLMKDLEIAAGIFTFLMPEWLIYDEPLIFTTLYEPTDKVGGDLLDIVKLDNERYLIYIGDISGHGVQAALLVTAVKSVINMLLKNDRELKSIADFLNRLNKLLSVEILKSNYLTIIFGILDLKENSYRYLNAGHPPILELSPGEKEVATIESEGSVPLGFSQTIEYSPNDESILTLSEKKSYLFYTDGIFECSRDKEDGTSEELGMKGLSEMIKEKLGSSDPILLPYLLKQQLKREHYHLYHDDFTVLNLSKLMSSKRIRHFSLNSSLARVKEISLKCGNYINEELLDEELAMKVEIIVNEYLNNIIIHGLEQKKGSTILLKLKLKEDRLLLLFYDRGKRWNLPQELSREDYTIEEDKRRVCGRGLAMIKELSSHFALRHYKGINKTAIVLRYESTSNR